jgi:signal transduction histidine kinase
VPKLAAVGKLSAKVAHEVNNPLAIIKTSVHLINKQMADDDPNKANLDIVEEEIARIARIVKQLLESTRPKTEIAAVDVNDVIRQIMKLATDELTSQGVESVLDLAADLPLPRLSLDQFKQVLLNLINNAREAMPHGGTLRIETARQHGGMSLRVIDTGIGIREEHLARLFQPFFSTKQPAEGTGLGLSVYQSIINYFGGSIEVESRPGTGTTFRVFLPEYSPRLIGASEASPPERLPEPPKEIHV